MANVSCICKARKRLILLGTLVRKIETKLGKRFGVKFRGMLKSSAKGTKYRTSQDGCHGSLRHGPKGNRVDNLKYCQNRLLTDSGKGYCQLKSRWERACPTNSAASRFNSWQDHFDTREAFLLKHQATMDKIKAKCDRMGQTQTFVAQITMNRNVGVFAKLAGKNDIDWFINGEGSEAKFVFEYDPAEQSWFEKTGYVLEKGPNITQFTKQQAAQVTGVAGCRIVKGIVDLWAIRNSYK